MCCTTKKSNGLSWALSILFVVAYLICYVWYWLRPDPAVQELHTNLLKLAFFGFTGMNAVSFVAGLVQVFIWGWIVAVIWKPLHAKFCCGEMQKTAS